MAPACGALSSSVIAPEPSDFASTAVSLRDAAPDRGGRAVGPSVLPKLVQHSCPAHHCRERMGRRRSSIKCQPDRVADSRMDRSALRCACVAVGDSHPGELVNHKASELRRCAGGGILIISFGATASFLVEVPRSREGEVPGKPVSFGEAVAAAITSRWSGRASSPTFCSRACVRAAQLNR